VLIGQGFSQNKLTYRHISNASSVVSIATGYGLDNRGVRFILLVVSRIFFSPQSKTSSEVHPTSYPTGTGDSFSRS
jgi:hypothetical protein